MQSELIPFDVEKALAGAPVITRDGREVPEIARFESASSHYKVYASIDGEIESFTEDGHFYTHNSVNDLFMLNK